MSESLFLATSIVPLWLRAEENVFSVRYTLKLKEQLIIEHNQVTIFLVNESNARCILSKNKEATNGSGHGVVQAYCGCSSFSGHVARFTVLTFF